MIGRLVCCVVLGLAALPVVAAEDINFSDLQRPGAGLSRSAVVPGLAKEGASFVSRFREVDSGRIEDRNRVGASSGGSSGRGGSSGGKATWTIDGRFGKNAWWNEGGLRMTCRTGRKAGETFEVFLKKTGKWEHLQGGGVMETPDQLGAWVCN